MNPVVSVTLPIYNAAKFLHDCLDSIATQTYKSFELIAIDDHSTDGSWEILQNFARDKKWVRISRHNKNLGVSPTFNEAVKLSKAGYIARMDADDIMAPNRLKLQVEYLQSHAQTVIVGGQCNLIDENNHVIGKKTFPYNHAEIKNMLFQTVPMQQPTIMINRKLLPQNFLYSNSQFSPAEDYGLFFSALKYGQFANLPETTLSYREHKTNISLVRPKFTFWRIWRARLDGILHQGYIPSFSATITVLAQTLAILILPNKIIYPLHKLTRNMRVSPTAARHMR